MNLNLLYPIFLKISYHAKGEFWKHLFENMAYGKPPHCVYIRNHPEKSEMSLLYNHKKRGFIFFMNDKNDKNELYLNIKKLLMNNVKIYSIYDKVIDQNICLKDIDNWNALKKTFIKNNLVSRYVIEKLKPESMIEAKKLINKINLGLSFKTINTKNIVMKDNKIEYLDLTDL